MAGEDDSGDSSSRAVPRVLVVDDDVMLTASICKGLASHGLAVQVANDGASALEMLETERFDVMVLDLRMSPMGGMEIFEQSRRLPEPPPTILMSGHLDVATTVLTMRAGVDEVLEKPVETAVLAKCIRATAKRGRCRQSEIELPTTPALTGVERILGSSAAILLLREQVRSAARYPSMPVLVQGETGTGKELVAQALHELCAPDQPHVSLNCAAIPKELCESELFGHEAGAFTGARVGRMGLFEVAARGTIFLDEMGEMPLELQPKLLRVLETGKFRRIGSNRELTLQARIVSASNCDLAMASSGFRSDLYYRLAGFVVTTPSLRERPEDIAELAEHFLVSFSERHQRSFTLTESGIRILTEADWPGNARQLRAVVESAAVASEDGSVGAYEVEVALSPGASLLAGERSPGSDRIAETVLRGTPGLKLPEVERELILRTFEDTQRNLSEAARRLGIPRSTLRDRLRRYGAR